MQWEHVTEVTACHPFLADILVTAPLVESRRVGVTSLAPGIHTRGGKRKPSRKPRPNPLKQTVLGTAEENGDCSDYRSAVVSLEIETVAA